MKVTLKTVVLSLLIGTPITFIVIVMVSLFNYQNRQLLCDAISEANIAKATQLLRRGENPNKKCEIIIGSNGYYNTSGRYRLLYPIAVAVWKGNDEILKLLIKKGAVINIPDAITDSVAQPRSLLNTSVRGLHVSTTEILLENKAEPTPNVNLLEELEKGIRDDGMSTSYETSSKTHKSEKQERKNSRSSAIMEMLALLISRKLVNLDDHSRDDKFPINNPLNSAVSSGHLNLVALLIARGHRGPVLYSSFASICGPNLYPTKEMAGILISNNIRILKTNSSDDSIPGYYRSVVPSPTGQGCP